MTERLLEPSTQLSFQLMNQMLDELAKNESGKAAGPVERWAFCIGLLGAALGMLFGTLLSNALGLQIAWIGLGEKRGQRPLFPRGCRLLASVPFVEANH